MRTVGPGVLSIAEINSDYESVALPTELGWPNAFCSSFVVEPLNWFSAISNYTIPCQELYR